MDPIQACDLISIIFKNLHIEIEVLETNIELNKAKIKILRGY